jgi:LEA14-like dessication related protein
MFIGLNGVLADIPKVNAIPNPASSSLNIQVTSTELSTIKIKLFSVLGSEVTNLDIHETDNKGGYSLNVSQIQDGIYLLTVQSGKEQVTKRIKIQH